MSNLIRNSFVGLFVLFMFPIISQGQTLHISGEVRPRAEYRHGYKSLADSAQKPAFYIDQRTRLTIGFDYKMIETKLVIQDVRTWGSQPQLVVADGNMTSIHEAWGRVYFHKNFSMKLGRQEISYDDHRIFGNVGWAQQARSHDAIVLMYQDSLMQIHGGFAYNQNAPSLKGTIYTVPKSYKTFQYLWAHRKFGPLSASLLFLNNGKQVVDINNNVYLDSAGYGRTHFTQTIGARLSFKKAGLTANLAGYYQGGREADTLNTLGTLVSAYYLGADVKYTLAKKYTIGIGAELLSGNNTVVDSSNNNPINTNNAFNPLYGTNHKFNGFMDYFYVGNHIANVGLVDLFLTFKAKIGKGFVGLHGHFFLSNGLLADPSDQTQAVLPYLGTELDFFGGYKINKWTAVKLGYSQLFGSPSMVALKGGNIRATSNWAWLMITINPSATISLKKKQDL
ncbi:alginate export family protein [Aureispira anguillae]|uniref:Alginate export family protein n=1 Tax=Aureispira anguillae TaxID=2864201 RepID=A0A915YKI0_9BACT|nr:alginate export family protein [Aureispira anguillae]BDS14760.1 alginate export family protein [Aureispira anguillae]